MKFESNSPNVLGVYLGHDLAACLLRGGQVAVMIEEERLNRFKHGRPNFVAGIWGQFAGKFGYIPWASMSYCLEAAGLGIDDIDLITFGDHLWAASAANTLREVIPIKDRNKVVFITEPAGAVHHYHHALSAFMASPFDHAAVLVIDADGSSNSVGYEAESGYLFEGRDGKHVHIFKNRYTSSGPFRSGIGWTYELVTRLLGFTNPKIFLADAGKTMGLAAYGAARQEFNLKTWIRHDGLKLDFSAFHNWLIESGYDSRILNNKVGLANQSQAISQYAKDIAFKAQSELESAVLHLADELYQRTQARNLCLAGGVALNSVANGLLVKRGKFERVFIQPAANDAGQAIGLAYHGHLLLTTNQSQSGYSGMSLPCAGRQKPEPPRFSEKIRPIPHAYGGRRYTAEEILPLLVEAGLPYVEFPNDEALAEDAATELASSKIIGWLQRGSEYGPRALGHRSILVDPRGPDTKDKVNSRVKFRESFRPFAPSVLLERAREVFDLECDSPYMLLVAEVREQWRERIPAVVHEDGTARIQTVDRLVTPLLYSLIERFCTLTGVPLLLNTSFNLRGMPIVETPWDAIQCFLYTDLDCLYLERFKLNRPALSLLFPSLSEGWQVSVKHCPGAAGRTVSFVDRAGSRTIELELMPELADLLLYLDGARSLAHACRQTLQTDAETVERNSAVEAVSIVQRLVRSGAMTLRVGNLSFGEKSDDTHWWQSPSTLK